MSTQLFGGWLASRIGGKRVFGFGIAVTSFFTILTPPITRHSVYLLIGARILEGIGEVRLLTSIIFDKYFFFNSLHLTGCDLPLYPCNMGQLGAATRALKVSDTRVFRKLCGDCFCNARLWNHGREIGLAKCFLRIRYYGIILVRVLEHRR